MDRFADIILMPIAMFTGRPLAVGLALGILAVAFGLWIFVLLPAEWRFVGRLKRLARSIHAARRTEGSQEAHFAAVDGVFADSDLARQWGRYRSSVEFMDGKAESYADPAAFFSVLYLPGHGYAKWAGTLGGVFLTIGLFFTFVGLSAALLQMGGEGHGALDPAQLKLAVEGILAVSSVKFITSIAGILAYIFWSLVARQQSASQVHAEQSLLEEIRALSTYVAPEMLLRRQVRLAEAQRDQFSGLVATLSDRLGRRADVDLSGNLDALPQAIANSVAASVANSIAPVHAEISALIARIGEANGEAAESSAAFGALVQDGIGQPLQAFGAQMANALAALDALPGKFRDAEAGIGGMVGQSAGELAEAAARMNSALERGQSSLAATLAAFEEKVGAIPSSLSAATHHSSQAMQAALRETLDGAAASANEASRASGEILSARMAEISESLTAVAALLHNAGQASHAQMSEGAKLLSESSENSAARLSATIDSFSLAVSRLSARFDQVERGLDSQTVSLSKAGEIVSGASNRLAQAAGAMESAATPLIGLEASATRMNAALERGQSSLAATLEAFEEKVGGIPASLSAATHHSSQAMQAALRETLEGAAVSATEASRASGEILSARMAEISGSLTAVAALFLSAGQASHEQMSEGAKLLSESSETSAARLSATIESFSLAVSRLAARLDQVERGLDSQNLRLSKAGEIVSGASNSLAQAAGALESAATPLTSASLSFRGAMERFSEAACQIGRISSSGDTIAAHIAAFGTQMTQSLAAFDALPEKIRATESGFGGEIARTAGQLTEAALRMSAGFERGQSALAETLASFEAKIAAIPSSLAAASEKTSQEIGDRVRMALDDSAAIATQASRGSADIIASRVGDIAHSLAAAAVKLQAASEASGAQMQASGGDLASGVARGVKIIADTAEDSAAKLSRTVETFAAAVLGLSSKLGEVLDGLDAHNVRLEQAGVAVSGASNTLAQAAGSVAKAATPLTTATISFQGAIENFTGVAEQIRTISNSGQSVADRIERTAAAADLALGSHAQNFRAVERSVAHTLTELVTGVHSLGSEITQCIETYDNEIAKSIGSLETALIDIGDIVDDRANKRRAAERR